VLLANHLPPALVESHLMTTRSDGPLAAGLAPSVIKTGLARRSRFDGRAMLRLITYLRRQQIRLIHAHSTSAFMAVLAARLVPGVRVVWHEHYGQRATVQQPPLPYRMLARLVDGVVTVNQPLAEWMVQTLGVRADRVWYLPNFVTLPKENHAQLALPGAPEFRIVCVGNLRPEKDHLGLVTAMQLVCAACPKAHLLLVGEPRDMAYAAAVRQRVDTLGLQQQITLLGPRSDVPDILRQCALGVLSSAAEGLPMTLLEYGAARLPVVATDVGQCADVLDHGEVGVLVPSQSPPALAAAILDLLASAERRQYYAGRFYERVQAHYSPHAVIERMVAVYQTVIGER
jgi:glycosyltransferase involved in cell wall biosynthesis